MRVHPSEPVGGEVAPDQDPAPLPGTDEASVAGEVQPASSVDDLVRFDPQWCLFWGRSVLSSQLDVWFPYLKRSRHRFVVMGTTGIGAPDRERLAALPNVMVLDAYETTLDRLGRCQHFEGFLYVSTVEENFVNVNRQRRRLHVFIGHGESGKGGSGSRTASIYDAAFVADYGVVRRYPRAIRRWVGSGALAIGAPVVMSNREPWHWHRIVVPTRRPPESGQAGSAQVQRSSNA